MKQIVSLCLLLVLGFTCAGCDLVPSPTVPSSADPDGWLGQNSGGVYWLVDYYTDSNATNGPVKGTYYSEYLKAGKIINAQYSITGTEINGKIDFTFQSGQIQMPVQGVENNSIVTLTMNEDGITKTITLAGASVDDWHNALSTFTAKHTVSSK